MDRPKRAATKVTNFRKYHLSGNLDEEVEGLVGARVGQFEMAKTLEELQQQLETERENSKRLQQDADRARIEHELELERMKQEQWQVAMDKIKEAREQASQEHSKCLQRMEQVAQNTMREASHHSLEWLKSQMAKLSANPSREPELTEEQERIRKQQQEKEAAIQELRAQQEEITRKLADLEGGSQPPAGDPLSSIRATLHSGGPQPRKQEVLLQQLRSALSGKQEEDPNKALLKALLTQQNKASGDDGTSTLKPNILNRLLLSEPKGMAEWLANLNKQEEGEFDISRIPLLGEEDNQGKAVRVKSGILDKATTNIQQKQVWLQQNLGEDWADEEVEFKQMKFEHLVAGETRPIETCMDPAEILGRLRLLRRVAYLKLRGYEWNLIRKMSAAILTSIETKEYSWESNFDCFETILYRKTIIEHWPHHLESRPQEKEGRKRFCRDYNKDGCPKSSPHPVWLGSGLSTVKRMVYHLCAACLIRDKQQREHPEGHQDCPHRD